MPPHIAVARCFARTFTFSGRASRAEYWWYWLFSMIAIWALAFIFAQFLNIEIDKSVPIGAQFAQAPEALERELANIGLLIGLATFVLGLPLWAAGWRRLHDVGRSGWWLFSPVIVVIGGAVLAEVVHPLRGVLAFGGAIGSIITAIWVFVLLLSPSNAAGDIYGPRPGSPEADGPRGSASLAPAFDADALIKRHMAAMTPSPTTAPAMATAATKPRRAGSNGSVVRRGERKMFGRRD